MLGNTPYRSVDKIENIDKEVVEGEPMPSESKYPQKSATQMVEQVTEMLTKTMDAIATQETGNTIAKADVKLEDRVVIPQVPLTVLLYLEKQLNDLHTFVGNFPVQDPAEQWQTNAQKGWSETSPGETIRTKKVQKALVLHPPTKEHPAQTVAITEDVMVGKYSTVKISTAFAATEKQGVLKRILALLDAVKIAREEANSVEVEQKHVAKPILDYVFNGQ